MVEGSSEGIHSIYTQRLIEKECSLSPIKWQLYNVYYHPDNKSSLAELRKMNIEEFFDHQESLQAIQMLKAAAHKDAEMISKLKTK